MSIDSVGSHSLADSPPEFRVLADLISVLADPEVSKRRVQAIADGLKDIEEARRALDADRAAHAAKVAEDRVALDGEKKAAAARWADAMDAVRAADAKKVRAEEYSKKVGFFEPPAFVEVSPGGMTRAAYTDPDPEPDPHMPDEPPPPHWTFMPQQPKPRARGAARRVELDQ